MKIPKVICHDCRFAFGYHPMYVGDDWRKWGTSICKRTKRHKRVDVLGGLDGCDYGEPNDAVRANRNEGKEVKG